VIDDFNQKIKDIENELKEYLMALKLVYNANNNVKAKILTDIRDIYKQITGDDNKDSCFKWFNSLTKKE